MINNKKKEQLGIDPGTAQNKLKKQLLFKYVKLSGDNICFQCGLEIDSYNDFTVEHKIPWLDSEKPSEVFFNLDNIGFSHHKCNVGAARKKKINPRHGTQWGYQNGCRCNDCKNIQYSAVKRCKENLKKLKIKI